MAARAKGATRATPWTVRSKCKLSLSTAMSDVVITRHRWHVYTNDQVLIPAGPNDLSVYRPVNASMRVWSTAVFYNRIPSGMLQLVSAPNLIIYSTTRYCYSRERTSDPVLAFPPCRSFVSKK